MTNVNTTPGQHASAISRLLVRTMNEFIGRGPTQVKTSIGPDAITVVLADVFTKAEKRLIHDGYSEQVLGMRRLFQHAMRRDLVAGVEQIIGRQVLAFLSDTHVDPDVAVEIFILGPEPAEPDTPETYNEPGTAAP